ncbi:MAG TPA: cytochrome c3 family protein [Vicinamibacterales bacterium]|nr:cytochrome c3 family protein [Vicinamibacterales bacterium]
MRSDAVPIVRVLRLLALLLAVLAGAASRAEAQFETPNRQFHNQTTFPLDGRHRDLPCESCHRGGVYKGTPTRCFDCHWTRRQDDRYRLQLGPQCEQCHRTTSWTAVRWDHTAMTSMPLGVAHRQLACTSCHANNSFRTAQTSCVSCHQQDYQAARTPNHVAAGFPTACEACHKPSDATFNQARFDHQASFPLTGTHASITCASCHRGNVFKGTPRDCVGCHKPDYDRTATPNHAAAGFPTTCENCHRPSDTSFKGAGFNHNQVFALVGDHASVSCATCHRNSVYRGTPRDCVGCHRADYDRTTAPNHAAAGFPTACENCHRPSDSSFRGAGFNHNSVFALVGDHASVSCATCHVNNVYRGTPRDCVGCHRADYDRTTAPNHAASGFSTSCEGCHRASDTSFRGASFNHSSVFPLAGRHATTSCTSCHGNGVYKGTATTCVGCHRSSYDRTTSPNHIAAGFPTSCENCHRNSDSSWTQGVFSHRFPITSGPHRTACATCHTTANSFATFNCLTCHGRSETDGHHRGVNGYRYDSVACYSCHPNGRH